MPNNPPNPPVETRRLRATLRLCFSAERADALAARLAPDHPDPVAALAPVMRLARLSFSADRWLALIRRSRFSLPLQPGPRLPAIPALALALHLGLGLDIGQLSRLFHRSPDKIGPVLQQARRTVDPTHVAPCPEFVAAIGRYRDPSPDRLERLRFMQHLEGCERCQLALERARRIDARLVAAIERAEAELNSTALTRSSRAAWLAPALFGGMTTLLAIVVIVAGVTASRRILGSQSTPVPLLAADQPPPRFSGWLLERSQTNAIDAINVATGQQRALIPSLAASGSAVYVSPNEERIAVITSEPPKTSSVRIYRIDGALLHQWPLTDSSHSGSVLGWLDSSHMMVWQVPFPAVGESQAHYRDRWPDIEQLIALDVVTGARQVMFDGEIDSAYVSPDKRYVAVDRMMSVGQSRLEIRPLADGKLGDPVSTFNSPYLAPAVWTPDSRNLVFFVDVSSDPNVAGSIDSMTLDGKVVQLRLLPAYDDFPIPNEPSQTISEPVDYSVVSVSPDGQQIVYAEGTGQLGSFPFICRTMPLSGGAGRKVAVSDASTTLIPRPNVVWSPDGKSMALSVEQPFYLPHPQQGSSFSSITSYITLAFSTNGDPQGALLDQFDGQQPLAWLPDSALQASVEQPPLSGIFHTQGTARDISVRPQLTENSRLSPDGSEALIFDKTYDFSLAAPLAGGQAVIAGTSIDPSWLPDGSGAVGVQHHSDNGRTISRITIYGQTSNGGVPGGAMTPLDFDPAQLGNSTIASYREPLLAPNGLRYSFFVVDGPTVNLWIGGFNQPPSVVTHWTVPNGAKVDPPLIATWVDNDTLIFSEPDEWLNGLPQHESLERVTLMASGAPKIASLVGWHARGNEQGVVLQELRPSPDASRIAFRLRHYTGTNLTKDRFDSLLVAENSDVTQWVELGRGLSGDGMSWSPNGAELTAVINGRLEVMTSDGSNVQTIDTGGKTVSFPLWVLPNQIWYESGNAAQVMVAKR